MIRNSRLILALDVLSEEKALSLASALKDRIDYVKVGYPLILAAGLDIVGEISSMAPVIADLKIADIPNTNTLISEQVLEAGAAGIIAHAFAGRDSLSACVNVAREYGALAFAVTEMSHPGAVEFMAPAAERLARVAKECDVDGVVAPATRPERIRLIRSIVGERAIISPGVGAQGGSPRAALAAGADSLIVGRSITESPNPAASVDAILREIQ
ncbi:MAG: orotidine-5'-phosphate decarboxylase [Methanothrix sp.]|jgi:orotidine-5'-phosphate decarboxylase|uniref:Orotidine 5'-phosphate decarboxylase n=1 Tax=Methanothrix harundinacea TaxID=301375 RepID=A0A101ILU8_9EURY|nr:MAG: Orotidine 5'-phosphate decarboxylase [Methanothrix harundinacea]MDD3708780.1 orotidine-5'-phosphate decarboxylase [Methanothrix sp.]MDI9400109.1 orotidine-5'-phosphate decarboxylase [Euryarchaeota archaeon]KUK97604.1 MAG: Orotidine 5'-phosphate decarboxylase [Methanothrix harundinacea]MCP1393572.1 orotidine-5'-phosphate decarboxylase [Methanothrix harundinacea]